MRFLGNLTGMPAPKFAIGQTVQISYDFEDGRHFDYEGMVVGIFPAPPLWLAGWWYVVRYTTTPDWEPIQVPYDSETHESEIALLQP